MATELVQTTSNRPALTDPEAVEAVLDDYEPIPHHGTLTLEVQDGCLACYGEAGFDPYPTAALEEVDNRYEAIDRKQFLEAVAPYLDENLVIQEQRWAKLRYPFGGTLYLAEAGTERVAIETFHDRQQAFFEVEG